MLKKMGQNDQQFFYDFIAKRFSNRFPLIELEVIKYHNKTFRPSITQTTMRYSR